MKMLLILMLVSLCLSNPWSTNKVDSNLQQIESVLNDYLIGGTENDAARVASAFHPDAKMKYLVDGVYKEVNAADFFRKGIKPGPKSNRVTDIVSVDVTGDVAFAKLKIDYPDKFFTDYMALMKVDGKWTIINKSFHVTTKSNPGKAQK